jgi:glycerol-3-phosphate dehydrogenase
VQGVVYDVAVIGGGINGTAIARDAAGRGLSVYLCEEADLASGASSATGKLVHGALEAVEGFRLGVMREAVVEREILMRAAPHLVRPVTFHIPHHERQWSPAALRFGLFAWDHVARSSLAPARRVDLEAEAAHGPLHGHFAVAFAYTDCVADDSRLVMLNAIDARARGATIAPRVRCTVAERDGGRWRLSLEAADGERSVVLAKALINAAGAAAGDVLNHVVHARQQVRVRMTKSAYLVLRWPHGGEVAYALPNGDGRMVYAVPYEPGTLLLGPAEGAYTGDPFAATVEEGDAAYLMDVAAQYFHTALGPDDVLWSFASVAALPDDALSQRRGSAVVLDAPPNVAPLISVFGGTLATHRRLAETAVDRLGKFRKLAPGWTTGSVLPGGGFPRNGAGDLVRALMAAYPFLRSGLADRLVRAYGTRASSVLTGARSASDLGALYGADLTPAEVDFLCHEEWAETAEDILWRRSKLGLRFTAAEAAGLSASLAVMARQLAPAG